MLIQELYNERDANSDRYLTANHVKEESVLRERLSSIGNRTHELELELRASQIELEELQDSNAVDSESNETSEINTTKVVSDSAFKPIDTAKFAKTLRSILSDHNISIHLFVREVSRAVGMTVNQVNYTLNASKPWTECNPNVKRMYQKMLEWSQSESKIKSLKALRELECFSHERGNHLSLPDLPDTPLDTVQLNKKIEAILKANNIPKYLFGLELLGNESSDVELRDCLSLKPKSWSELTSYRKRIYVRMNDWSNCEESIRSLEELAKSKRNTQLSNSNDETNVPDNLQLNTASVTRTIKGILKAKCITKTLFAKQVLSIDRSLFRYFLNQPTPWVKCSEHKKKMYLKMHEWSQSSDAIQLLATQTDSKRKRRTFYYSKDLFEVPPEVELDTATVVRTLDEILESESITRGVFAKHVVGLDASRFGKLLNHPTPWSECFEYKKGIYFKIHEWSQSSDAIRSLAALSRSQAKTSRLSQTKNLPKVPSTIELDTAKVASTLKEILLAESITRKVFAEKVVNMEASHFLNLLNYPTPWTKCTGYKKKLYFKFHEWSQSTDEIQSLKASI